MTSFLDGRTARQLLTLLVFAVVLAGVYYARRIILVFVIAILVAYLLDPVVRFLQHHSLLFRNLRGPAVVEVYLGALILLLALLFYGIAPGLPQTAGKLVPGIPALLNDLLNWDLAKTLLARHRADIEMAGRNLEMAVPDVLGGLLAVPILAIFFLRDGSRMADGLIDLAGRWGDRARIRALTEQLHGALRHYVRTKVTLAGLSLGFYCAALLLLRFPHALALGLIGALLEFIPVAGWMISAAAIVSVGVMTQSHWVWMFVLLLMWRVTQNYFTAPRLLGQQLEIHPLIAIFGFMVGWEIDGIIGVYLSVPLMAVGSVVWRTFGPCAGKHQAKHDPVAERDP